jgi:glycosyltransferase involved in cell wall biosynthesis
VVDVTVVVPTHNRCRLLSETIASILQQSDVSLELVVVNDGSTDGTGAWLNRVAAGDPRVKAVHHDRPRRLPSARNAGIAHASARWVAFCDDDDLWAPGKLAAQLRALEATSAGWSCTGVVDVDQRLAIIGHHRVKGGRVLGDLLKGNFIPSGSSVTAELGLVKAVGGFDKGLVASEDWEMWIRLAQRSPLAAVDRPLVAYRQGPQTHSMDVDRMRASWSVIVDRYAAVATEHGVKPDEACYERFIAKQLLRAGSGFKAASVFATLVTRHRRWREVPRVPAALLAPRLTDRIGTARATAAVPPSWRGEADAWLSPIRSAAGSHASTDRDDPGGTRHAGTDFHQAVYGQRPCGV